jgi:hypothetical protein
MTNNKESEMTTTKWDTLWEAMTELEKSPWVEKATDYLLSMGWIPMVDSIWDTNIYADRIDEKAQDLWLRELQ